MIKTERITINGNEFVKTYSDTNHYIIQEGTNAVYGEAIDPVTVSRNYHESEDIIPQEVNIDGLEADIG